MKLLVVLLALYMTGSASVTLAAVDVYKFDSPEQEQQYRRLIEELRCTVCQNQNIAGSNAELAMDLRRKTYELVSEGKSDEEILGYMSARYGNFVLYSPPLSGGTMVLWIGPFVLFALGGLLLLRSIRQRRAGEGEPSESGVDDQKLQKAASLLSDKGDRA